MNYLRVFPALLFVVLLSLSLPAIGFGAPPPGLTPPANLRITGSATQEDFPTDSWVMLSPTAEEDSPFFGWEYAGVFDSVNRKWVHYGGHDPGNLSVQNFSVWTYDVDRDDWQVNFAPDGPPGT